MDPPLVRPEVVNAQRQQWLGNVRLVRPLSLRLLTLGALLVVGALATFLYFGEYTRKARVGGLLMPDAGLIRLASPVAATVLQRPAREGQAVRAGDVLFVLGLDRGGLAEGLQAQVLASLAQRVASLNQATQQQDQLTQAQARSIDERLVQLQREQAQILAGLALQRERLKLARNDLTRLQALRDEQFASGAQVQAKRDEWLSLQAQAQALERQGAGLSRERAAIEGERAALPLRSGARQGEIARELAALSREAAEADSTRQLVIRAPQDGSLSTLLVQSGQGVAANTVLASLVPSGAALQAHLYAPSSAVGFVKAGQAVQLRYEAFAYQKFGHQRGRVLHVSRTPLAPAELAQLPLAGSAAASEPLFRVTVELAEGQAMPEPLVAGMRLTADVQLERRRLVEWLLAPLAAMKARV